MTRVLFLYATNKCGHQKAAEAIRRCLVRMAPGVETLSRDFFTFHYPNVGPLISRIYVEVMVRLRSTWDFLYDSPGIAARTTELRQLFSLLNLPKLYEDIRRYKPSVIMCTQAIPAGFLAMEKGRGKIHLPVLATVTDFVVNPYWPDRNIDTYFVPSEEMKRELLQRGFPGDRIRVTGIPIDSSFARLVPKNVARLKLGLAPDLPTVLIMGGSQGLGQIPDVVRSLASSGRKYQLLVVAGYNRTLLRHLREEYGDRRDVLVFGHTRNIARLMDAADVLVSKPGGLTTSEALAKGLPMIIFSPLPGQEERNSSFLLRHRVAERCDDLRRIPEVLESLFGQPQNLDRYRSRALALARPDSSRDIAQALLEFIPGYCAASEEQQPAYADV